MFLQVTQRELEQKKKNIDKDVIQSEDLTLAEIYDDLREIDQYEKNQIKVIEKNRLQRKAMESILDKKESTLITLLQGDSVRTQKSKQNEKNKI